ncbi:hypothetical protein ACN28E_25175 [Archangium lansingense]|uniref:hypothetical protein n=1 Tax=Archangium lansingense TaxID=2995310 RepID=UPI003B7DB1D9
MGLDKWMGEIDDNVRLSELVMPGSHDACMYKVRSGSGSKVAKTVTQFLTIKQQLNIGTRFFDIRVYKDGQTLRPGHFIKKDKSDWFGSYGPEFSNVMRDLQDFMESSTEEVVIIKFSTSKAAHDDAIRMIEYELSDFLFTSRAPRNLADMKLGNLRGKILGVFDAEEGRRGGLQLVSKKTPTADKHFDQPRSMLWLNGDAPQCNNIRKVMEKQNEKRKAQDQVLLAPHLEMFYLTITAGVRDVFAGHTSIVDNTSREFGLRPIERNRPDPEYSPYGGWGGDAAEAYGRYVDAVQGDNDVNVFMYDFVNEDVNRMLIGRNIPTEGSVNHDDIRIAVSDSHSGRRR